MKKIPVCPMGRGKRYEALSVMAVKDMLNENTNNHDLSVYNLQVIARQLDETAMGDSFHGNSLRVAKDIPGVTAFQRSILDKYATGAEQTGDHLWLQALANQIRALDK